jgi:hypothetical protein
LQFGIRIILIESGAVGSNFWKNLKMARKASESNHHHHHSPYQQMINSMAEVFKKMKENTIPPSEIAEVILHAVT